jgi:hypothetical protein
MLARSEGRPQQKQACGQFGRQKVLFARPYDENWVDMADDSCHCVQKITRIAGRKDEHSAL